MKCFKLTILILVGFLATCNLFAQKHIANGDSLVSGNRLISVESPNGSQLYQPGNVFSQKDIRIDGKRSEPEWDAAPVVSPFMMKNGEADNTSVRVLYDGENIYLYWEVEEEGGLTSNMSKSDSVITDDDYIQVDLKPWLPDTIQYARDYYYTLAVNPDGVIWDSYFDPYLDGFFFSSWDSQIEVTTSGRRNRWIVEMKIPYKGLDLYSDPGWRWNLDFRHGSYHNGSSTLSAPEIGVTVQQDVMVRRPSLVSYYWPRPEFMQEVKPDLTGARPERARAAQMETLPEINGAVDAGFWKNVQTIPVERTDRMGAPLEQNTARGHVAVASDKICLYLEADGAKTEEAEISEKELGEGMAAQMAGVNGVFVDQALFENECFWVILQPRKVGADHIHQDYYMIIVNNRGRVRGTWYDKYGAPTRDWSPQSSVDLFDTEKGWGAEVIIDMRSFDIPPSYDGQWGFNLFRNRLPEDEEYELQAWRYTGNDFLNPEKFGTLVDIPMNKISIVRSSMEQKRNRLKEKLADYDDAYGSQIKNIRSGLNDMPVNSMSDLNRAEDKLEHINHSLGVIDGETYYQSVPHPAEGGYPLMDVQFIGEKGWAVGPMGTILRTVDGGESWKRIEIDTDADLYRVDFVNQQEGWAAGGRLRLAESNEVMRHDKRGGYAYLYHTTDGGKTWECQFAERGRHLFGLDFVNEDTGYACGERGFFMKTEDGGNHWKVLPTTGTMNWLYGMTFIDENMGFAVGLRETVIKTQDGGKSWSKIDAPADRKPYGFRPIYRDISFSDNTGCIVGQNGSVLISHDQGETWQPAATLYKDKLRDLMDFRSVHFVTPRLGYAVGELGTGMMVTEDGGKSWTYRPTEGTEWLRAVWANSSGKVYVTGERETVLTSIDEGFTWRKLRGKKPKVDLMVLMAHGDDAAISLNGFYAHYGLNENKEIVDVGVMSDVHSSEYEETYNLEHDRNMWMIGVRTSSNFNEFETGNNGSDYYHFTERLWEGEHSVVRHLVAAIRAYRPDVVIAHGGVFGDYDKPGHKLSGRAGLRAFETAGGETDRWPELSRLGLNPWQPKKLYFKSSESYPATLDLTSVGKKPLKGTDMRCIDFGEYVIRNFQSQGVYHVRHGKLSLVKSLVPVPDQESSVFDGLE